MKYREKYELLFKRILAIVLAILIFGWMIIEDPDVDEPTLSIEDKCELVLRNQIDNNKKIITLCKKILEDHYDKS